MGANITPARMAAADFPLPDPGAGGKLPVTAWGQVEIRTLTAETRTWDDPSKPGLEIDLAFRSDGGNCVITFDSAYDDLGRTTLTLQTVGEIHSFKSVRISDSQCVWRRVGRSAEIPGDSIESVTSSTRVLTKADHKKTFVLDLAAGIAVTLPEANAENVGFEVDMIVKTTFTGAATVKSSRSADIWFGRALMGNDSDNAVVDFPCVVGSTIDTLDMLGTGNSTGGMAGQTMRFKCVGVNLWHVAVRGDAAGTEATPFANTVA